MVRSSFGVFDPLSFNLNEDELQWEHNVLPLESWLQVWTSPERHFGISAVFGMRCNIELSHTRHWSRRIFQNPERCSPFHLKASGSVASVCVCVSQMYKYATCLTGHSLFATMVLKLQHILFRTADILSFNRDNLTEINLLKLLFNLFLLHS